MSKVVSIKNLNFNYGDYKVFNDFNLDIVRGDFVSLVGPNGSGKSTLVRILTGLNDFDGSIEINTLILNKKNIQEIRKKIGFISNNLDNQFVTEKVVDNICFPLENLGFERKEILKNVNDIVNLLNISHLLEENIFGLNNFEKVLVNLAAVLVYKPTLLILDEALSNLDRYEREKILDLLHNLQNDNNITIINITHNMEDVLFGNNIIVLDKGNVIFNGSLEEVFKDDKIFTKLGLSLPFMVDLSIKLKYYNLIDRIIYDMEEMADLLWK